MSDAMVKISEILAGDFLFWFCALAGSGLFVIQFLISLVGGSDEADLDDDQLKVKWLSKQALTGFIMMFGWTALTCRHEFFFSDGMTLLTAFLVGSVTVLITGLIFRSARRLRSTGTIFRIEDAIGKEGVVYQKIPKNGTGKITISLHDLTHEIDAVSLNGEEIPSFAHVQIIKTTDERTLLVVPIK